MINLKNFNILVVFIVLLSACSTEDCTNPLAINFNPNAGKSCSDCCIYSNPNGSAEAILEINHLFDGFILDTSNVYDWNGRNIQISSIRYYLNTLKCNNDTLDADQNYLFIDLESSSLPLGEIPPNSYTSFDFNVGVSMNHNHFVPNSFGVDHPLSPKSPSMFWSVSEGHIFFEMVAKIDTSATPDGVLDEEFTLQFGTDALQQSISLGLNLEVPQDYTGDVVFHLEADYNKVLDSLDLNEIFLVNSSFPVNMEQAANRMEATLVLE